MFSKSKYVFISSARYTQLVCMLAVPWFFQRYIIATISTSGYSARIVLGLLGGVTWIHIRVVAFEAVISDQKGVCLRLRGEKWWPNGGSRNI